VESTTNDMSIYTEDKLYEDIKALISANIVDPMTNSGKDFRKALACKYGMESTDRKGKMFKKHDPFKKAIAKIIAELPNDAPSANEVEDKNQEKSDKLKKRMSRKRKRPSPDDEEQEDDDDNDVEDEDDINDSDPPTKKRRTNDGGAVVDDDDEEQSEDNESTKKKKRKKRKKRKKQEKEDESEGNQEEEEEEQEQERQTAKKKKGKEPYEATLTKLKKLARAAALANPKMYGELKSCGSNKKRVDFLKKLLTDNDVPITMNEKQIKKIQEDYALKREMADLGIGIGSSKQLDCEDGVPLSARRPKRTRKVVSYKTPKYKGDDFSEEEGDENGDDDDDDEYKEDSEESEVDEYEPPTSDVEYEE